MTALITGGAGFLGTALIRRLLAGPDAPSRIVCVDRDRSPVDDPRVDSRVGSITDASFLADAFTGVESVWHLAAVLSGQSEVEPDLAMAVNVGGTQALLEACRSLPRPPRFVLASTIAVYGGPLPQVVPEDFVLRPQTTYGTTKVIAELLVAEHTRRGAVDGVICRLPTVAIRPGAPNSALSGFVSGIVREPLAGLATVCPVPLDTRIWVSSPEVTTQNLVLAGRLPGDALGVIRTVNLPGLTVTPAELLDALGRLAGPDVRALVRVEPDPHVTRVMNGWPGGFDTNRALSLGFAQDESADAIVHEHIEARQTTAGR